MTQKLFAEPIVMDNKILLDTRWRGKGYVSAVQILPDGEYVFYRSTGD